MSCSSAIILLSKFNFAVCPRVQDFFVDIHMFIDPTSWWFTWLSAYLLLLYIYYILGLIWGIISIVSSIVLCGLSKSLKYIFVWLCKSQSFTCRNKAIRLCSSLVVKPSNMNASKLSKGKWHTRLVSCSFSSLVHTISQGKSSQTRKQKWKNQREM